MRGLEEVHWCPFGLPYPHGVLDAIVQLWLTLIDSAVRDDFQTQPTHLGLARSGCQAAFESGFNGGPFVTGDGIHDGVADEAVGEDDVFAEGAFADGAEFGDGGL